MTDRDPLLDRVIAELKRPIEVDPAARRRLLDAVAAGSRRRPAAALLRRAGLVGVAAAAGIVLAVLAWPGADNRSEEHTSELQSRENLVCSLLLEKKSTR